MLVPLLGGCTFSEGPLVPPGSGGGAGPAGLWEAASGSHPAEARVQARELTLGGGELELASPGARLVLEPPPPVFREVPYPGGSPPPGPPGAPSHLLFEAAVVQGQKGTLVADFAERLTITALQGTVDPRVAIVKATPQGLRAPLGSAFRPPVRIEGEPCLPPPGEPCPPPQQSAPLPPAYAQGLVAEYILALPQGFTVEGRNLTFVDAGGNETSLGTRAEVSAARALLAPAGGTPSPPAQRVLAPPLRLGWDGNLTVAAAEAQGTLALSGRERSLAARVLSLAFRGQGSLELSEAGEGWALSPLRGDATDVVTDGTPRLGARLAAMPELFEAPAEAGKVVRMRLVLVETSGGAHAHLDGFRVEGSPGLEVRFAGMDPFPITRALLELAHEVVNHTRDTPEEETVTVPVLLGLGLGITFFAIAEAFLAAITALFPPTLTGSVEAGQSFVATFEARPESLPVEASLVIRGRNFDEQPVRLHLRAGSD